MGPETPEVQVYVIKEFSILAYDAMWTGIHTHTNKRFRLTTLQEEATSSSKSLVLRTNPHGTISHTTGTMFHCTMYEYY
jgi:hypothetical protein